MVHFSKGRFCGLYQKQPFKMLLDSLQYSNLCGTEEAGWDVFSYLIHVALGMVLRRLSSGAG